MAKSDYQPEGDECVTAGSGESGNRCGARSNGAVNLLLFRRMVTPIIIQIIFWMGVLAAIAIGGLFLVSSLQAGESAILGIFYGLAILIGGPIIMRILCELAIILFRMHEALNEIRDKINTVKK